MEVWKIAFHSILQIFHFIPILASPIFHTKISLLFHSIFRSILYHALAVGSQKKTENWHINALNMIFIHERLRIFLYSSYCTWFSSKVIPGNFWVDILQHFFFKHIKIQVKEMLPVVAMMLLNICAGPTRGGSGDTSYPGPEKFRSPR